MEKNNDGKQRFPVKLQEIIQDSKFSSIIRLNKEKFVIQILDQNNFSTNILPLFFRHSRMQSFFRQLNLYGFHKIRKQGYHCFYHPQLEKGIKIKQIISKKECKRRKMKQKRQKFLNKKNQKTNNIQNPIQQKYEELQPKQENLNFHNNLQNFQLSYPQSQYMNLNPYSCFVWPYWNETAFYAYI